MAEPTSNAITTPSLKHTGVWTKEQAREAGKRGAEARRIARLKAAQAAAIDAGQPPPPAQLEILERRLKQPVLSDAATTIRLRIAGQWALRWVNTDIEGRWDRATALQGWEPVKHGELKDDRQVLNLKVTPDGYVARGERMREVLMRMPQAFFDQIQLRKQELARKALSKGKIREATAARAVKAGREDVADAGDLLPETLIETREIVDLDPAEQERLTTPD